MTSFVRVSFYTIFSCLASHSFVCELEADDRFAAIDTLVANAIDAGETPGAVVLIGRHDGPVYQRAYGFRQTEPAKAAMELTTVFDLASLTKPIATASCIMKLVESGLIELDAPVDRYLPTFSTNGKSVVTVRDLLLHRSGLIADNHLRDYVGPRAESIHRIMNLELAHRHRMRFAYSDVGFIVLGEIVAAVSEESLADFSRREFFEPLQMLDTGYLPSAELKTRVAATGQRDGHWLVGEVHDPRAHRLDGVAGHAGLFSTADDLGRYAQMILNNGQLDGVRVFKPETVATMTAAHGVPGDQLRTLGWDAKSKYSSNRSELYSASAFGHGGFTGTSLWIDPELDLYVVFLGTRLHPDGHGSVNRTAAAVGSAAVRTLFSETR